MNGGPSPKDAEALAALDTLLGAEHLALAHVWQLALSMRHLADDPSRSPPGDLDARGTLRACSSLIEQAILTSVGRPP